MRLTCKQFILSNMSTIILSALFLYSVSSMTCDYTTMPDGREVIRVFNDGEDPGWFNIENNSKNHYGTINGYMVKLVNMKNPSNFVFLNPFMGESFSFQGEQFIGCEQANKPGVPFDWIRQYNRGEYIFKPIDCSKAGVTISRCYPQGSPGGQGNRSQKLGLISPKTPPKPSTGPGYAFGVYPSQKTPTTGETKSVVPSTMK